MKNFLLGLFLATAAVFAVAPRTAHAQAGIEQPAGHTEAQAGSLEWKRSVEDDTHYQKVTSTPLFVLQSDWLTFRVRKDDDNLAWSPGFPN